MIRLIIAALAAPLALTAAGSATVTATITIGPSACGIAAVGSSLYADSFAAGTVSKIDPATNRVVRKARVAFGPCGMTGGAGSLWVEDYNGDAVVRVNPATLKVVKRIHTGSL